MTKGATANTAAVPPKSQFSFGSMPAAATKSTFSFGSNASATATGTANTNATTSVASTFSFGNLASKSIAQSSFTFGNVKSDTTALASSSSEKTVDDKAKEASQKPASSAQFSFGNPTVLPSTVKTDTTTSTSAAAIPSLTAPSTTDNVFKSIVEKQKASSWECASCMAKNPNEKEKCTCCDAPKPGAVANESVKKDFGFSTNQKFSFGAPASSTFSFGSQPTENKPSFQFGSPSSTASAGAPITTTTAAAAVATSTTTLSTNIFGSNLKSPMFSMPTKPAPAPSTGTPFLFGSAVAAASKDVTDTGPSAGATNKGITILDNVLIKPAENGPNEVPKLLFGQGVAKSSDDDPVAKAKKRSNTELIDSSISTKLPTTATGSTGMASFVFGQPQPANNNIFGAIASNPATSAAGAAVAATTKSQLTAPNPTFSFGSNSQTTGAFSTTQSTFSFGANSAAPAQATATIPAPSAFGAVPAENPPSQRIFGSNPLSSLPTLGGFAANSSFGSSAPAFGTPSPSNNEVNYI